MCVLGVILLVYPSILITLLIIASPSDTDGEWAENQSQISQFYFSFISAVSLKGGEDGAVGFKDIGGYTVTSFI